MRRNHKSRSSSFVAASIILLVDILFIFSYHNKQDDQWSYP